MSGKHEGSMSRIESSQKEISLNQNSINYPEFKSALFEVSKAVITPNEENDEYISCI